MQTNPDGQRRSEFMVPFEVTAARMELFDKTDFRGFQEKASHHKGAVTIDQPLLCKHRKR
jgi:hypothetical protein